VSRILLAWELGGNLGHVTRLLVLARALRAAGHHVSFALGQSRFAAETLAQAGFSYAQAPVLRATTPDLPREPASYPEILLHYGFADPALLTAAARHWRERYRSLSPDVAVFDHAPSALLAARDTGIPRVVLGTGFASPPRVAPMPIIRPWQQIPPERLFASEQRALDSANAASRSIGAEPMNHLYELFDVEENILATLPELDHYGARPDTRYWGPIFQNAGGHLPRWPEAQGTRKIFVYIRPGSAAFSPLVTALRRLNLSTLWFAPGLRDDALAQLRSPTLEFIRDPVDIAAVSALADAAVLHGGHGTTAAMLLAGVPVLLLPEHVEQLLLGRNVAALGAGAALNIGSPGLQIAEILQRITNDPRYGLHAKDFAARNSHRHRTDQHRELVTLIGAAARNTKPREIHVNAAMAKA
jgi:UDP:flavonoid glycosyltransferase YjiC (YdhE family)